LEIVVGRKTILAAVWWIVAITINTMAISPTQRAVDFYRSKERDQKWFPPTKLVEAAVKTTPKAAKKETWSQVSR